MVHKGIKQKEKEPSEEGQQNAGETATKLRAVIYPGGGNRGTTHSQNAVCI